MSVKAKGKTSLKDVARSLGVSPATVSNAFNRPDQLSPELRERILQTARNLGYSPDPLARGLRRGRAGAVGVLYADRLRYTFADPVAGLFMQGLGQVVEEANLGMLLVPKRINQESLVAQAAVDGFVVYSIPNNSPTIQTVLARGLPTVVVDYPPIEGLPAVNVDDFGGARQAAQHLLELGHRRIGVVSLEYSVDAKGGFASLERQSIPQHTAVVKRLDGYRNALEAAGLDWAQVPVWEVAENLIEEGERGGLAMLGLSPRPTALLCMSDQVAFGVYQACRARGIRIPEDLSVVGFDDIPETARTAPPLTTIHQPLLDKGLWAGRLLMAAIRGEQLELSGLLPTRLVVRGSTARPEEGVGQSNR